jgi:hypothetical protein
MKKLILAAVILAALAIVVGVANELGDIRIGNPALTP